MSQGPQSWRDGTVNQMENLSEFQTWTNSKKSLLKPHPQSTGQDGTGTHFQALTMPRMNQLPRKSGHQWSC